jgi:murein DD-endopeptidase MepM/ murein hydrolase activator NlpD
MRFPIASRFLAVSLALTAVSVVAVAAGASVTQSDRQQATNKVRDLLADVDAARAQLAAQQAKLDAASAALDDAIGQLEYVTAELLTTHQQYETAALEYRNTVQRLNDRAVEAYIQGPGQGIDLLIGASSLGDLSDRLEYMDAVAQQDADLAQQVENTKRELRIKERRLGELRAKQQQLVIQAKARQDEIQAGFEAQQAQLDRIQSDLSEAQRLKKKLDREWQQQLKAAAAQGYGGVHASVPIPPGYEHVLERCPVDGPRSFSDGFGAPRYAGGYHLHKGVDILAQYGTPIVAPFDGVASTSYNSLGGYVEFVSGKYGSVYNAHMQSPGVSGSVHAGDVVGYVGDTGDAQGTPHDHFEFHPNVMPSSWPVSAYGYSIIEDAVNPYPLLVAACG